MTVFPVGEDSLMLCSRCYAVVTQPWHDKLRETADALAEAQRDLGNLKEHCRTEHQMRVEAEEERDELRADLVFAAGSIVHRSVPLFPALGSKWMLDLGGYAVDVDGTAADLCRAIREARRGE